MEATPPSVSSADKANKKTRPNLHISLDFRWITLGLLVIILAMLLTWRPWHRGISVNDRTISVSGESTVKAAPDEYVFSPSYEFKDTDKTTVIKTTGDKETELTGKLKALGVADKGIKATIDGYEDYIPKPLGIGVRPPIDESTNGFTYTLQLTVTVANRALAQKVQDYLATTSPQGSVTPDPTLSESLRTKIESQARDIATKNARAKADQSARNLGFKVGSVKSVDDGTGIDSGRGIRPLQTSLDTGANNSIAAPKLSLQPGENDLTYSVSVVYYIH